MKKLTKDDRAKVIGTLMKLTYSSLESHLQATYAPKKKYDGGRSFQKKCVKDYAWTMFLLSRLY